MSSELSKIAKKFETIQDLEFQMKLENVEENPSFWTLEIFLTSIELLLDYAKKFETDMSSTLMLELHVHPQNLLDKKKEVAKLIENIADYYHEFKEKHS